MDSQEFLRALKHYSWIIILVSLFSVATTWAATFFLLQPIYKSDATILIKNRVMQEGQLIDESLLDEKYIKAFYNIAQSDTVAQNTIDELKLGWTLKYLRKIMNLEVDYYTGVIYIAATTNDPELSQKLVNVFINNLEIQTGNNMRSVSINIIDAPKLPKGPIGPNLILNLILSLAGGVAAGILFAIMLASGRNKMFKPSVREKLDTLFCLGYLPKIKRKKNIDSIEIRDLSIGTVLANLDYLIKKNSIK